MGSLPGDFSAQADFYSDLGMASVKAMQLLLEIEDKFGISMQDDEFVQATNLESLVRLVDVYLGQKGGAQAADRYS